MFCSRGCGRRQKQNSQNRGGGGRTVEMQRLTEYTAVYVLTRGGNCAGCDQLSADSKAKHIPTSELEHLKVPAHFTAVPASFLAAFDLPSAARKTVLCISPSLMWVRMSSNFRRYHGDQIQSSGNRWTDGRPRQEREGMESESSPLWLTCSGYGMQSKLAFTCDYLCTCVVNLRPRREQSGEV